MIGAYMSATLAFGFTCPAIKRVTSDRRWHTNARSLSRHRPQRSPHNSREKRRAWCSAIVESNFELVLTWLNASDSRETSTSWQERKAPWNSAQARRRRRRRGKEEEEGEERTRRRQEEGEEGGQHACSAEAGSSICGDRSRMPHTIMIVVLCLLLLLLLDRLLPYTVARW